MGKRHVGTSASRLVTRLVAPLKRNDLRIWLIAQ